MERLDKGMIRVLGGMERDGARFHRVQLCISGIFHLVFSDLD